MGHCIVVGGKPDMAAPVSGILASDLAVGSSVYLMEDGVAVEYLVVNQGKPSGSSLYDDSCDGTWLLRKNLKQNYQWNSSRVNDYQNSTIHSWLNSDFFNQFGSVEQAEQFIQDYIKHYNTTDKYYGNVTAHIVEEMCYIPCDPSNPGGKLYQSPRYSNYVDLEEVKAEGRL